MSYPSQILSLWLQTYLAINFPGLSGAAHRSASDVSALSDAPCQIDSQKETQSSHVITMAARRALTWLMMIDFPKFHPSSSGSSRSELSL